MESVSDTLSHYYQALKEIADIDILDEKYEWPGEDEYGINPLFHQIIDRAKKAIEPVDIPVVSHLEDQKIVPSITELIEDEPQDLRPGDVFELMGQKYSVHRVASKNIVIRKLKTVKIGGD